jgi:hypothetical protein
MPSRHLPKNERIKRAYLSYFEEAQGKTKGSANAVAAAIADFEATTKWRDFARFHVEQARRYKRALEERKNEKTGQPLSKSTIKSRLKALRAFFAWLAEQPGIHPLDAAHDELDAAVRNAYGMRPKADPLKFLFDLNQQLAAREAKAEPIVGPGLPHAFQSEKSLRSSDCLMIP